MNLLEFLLILAAGLIMIGALVTVTIFLYLVGPILLVVVLCYLLYEVINHAME